MKSKHSHITYFQISRAKSYIAKHLMENITLGELAIYSGASKYHFIRLFSAYTGETPFQYIRRMRVLEALELLHAVNKSVLDIALDLGFDSASSFNKAFKKITDVTPTTFRNLGKDGQAKIRESVCVTQQMESIIMHLNITKEPEIIFKDEMELFTLRAEGGNFREIAPLIWQDFTHILQKEGQDFTGSEFLGIGTIDAQSEKNIYKAAISQNDQHNLYFKSLTTETLPKSKYAKFLLTGSYQGVWHAFDFAVKHINKSDYVFADAPCLENYLNDPAITPEEELLTEILIPIK